MMPTTTTTTRAMTLSSSSTARGADARAGARRAVARRTGRRVARRAVRDPSSSSADDRVEASDSDETSREVSRAEVVRAAVASGAVGVAAARVGGGGAPPARDLDGGASVEEDRRAVYDGKTWRVRHGASALEVREDGTMRLSRTGDGPSTRPRTLAATLGGGGTARGDARVVDARADEASGSLMVSWSDGTELRVMRTSDAMGAVSYTHLTLPTKA